MTFVRRRLSPFNRSNRFSWSESADGAPPEAQIDDVLLDVPFQAVHRFGIPVLEFRDEIVPALQRRGVRGGLKRLRDEILHLGLHQGAAVSH